MSRPFILGHPRELWRLFSTGYIDAPNSKRWDISFCPGVKGAWKGFKKCWKFAWKSFKFAWDHTKIIKFMWELSGELCGSAKDLIAGIPNGFSEGCGNISSLWQDAPFGWIVRVFKNIGWNCFAWPIIKFFTGFLGFVATPCLFIFGSVVVCVGKWIVGLIGAAGGGVVSLVPLIGGTIISGGVTFGAIFNRFPRDADDGTYGLYLVTNQDQG